MPGPVSICLVRSSYLDWNDDILSRYKIEEAGLVESLTKAGVIALFDSDVHQSKTKLQIDYITFLTRVGGIIGVGKNLAWILIFTLSSVGGAWNFLKKYLKV